MGAQCEVKDLPAADAAGIQRNMKRHMTEYLMVVLMLVIYINGASAYVRQNARRGFFTGRGVRTGRKPVWKLRRT